MENGKYAAVKYLLVCLLFSLILSEGTSANSETAEAINNRETALTESLNLIPTIDNRDYGFSIKMIDFDGNQIQNWFLQDFSASHGKKVIPGLLSDHLGDDGYPVNRDGVSLSALFAGSAEVTHLFPQEPLLKYGIWEFDSTQCFASLQEDNTFRVYHELGTVDSENSVTLDHGQFLPFNDLVPGMFSAKHPTNERDALGNELAEDDPRKGEPLYGIPGNKADHYFALEMEARFSIPVSGKDSRGEEINACFSGDDDLWVYLDDVLVLDLGGIHSAVPGLIDFSSGAVTYRDSDGKDTTVKLYKLFRHRYEEQNPDARESQIQEYLNGLFRENEHWQMGLRDDIIHTMRIFYMERGAGASNLHVRFNMPLK